MKMFIQLVLSLLICFVVRTNYTF